MVILCELKEDSLLSANKISENTKVPLATTNKILRLLTQAKICASKGGKAGGFNLAMPPHTISLLQVIKAIEGYTPTFTQCISDTDCKIQKHCRISTKMQAIDKEINAVLSRKFISDLT